MTLILENIWGWASNIWHGVESLLDDETYHLINRTKTWLTNILGRNGSRTSTIVLGQRVLWIRTIILNIGSWFRSNLHSNDLGKPTHTLVPCGMPKPLPPRNQCSGSFAPTHSKSSPNDKMLPLFKRGGNLPTQINSKILKPLFSGFLGKLCNLSQQCDNHKPSKWIYTHRHISN